jgi:hypothetical protein
MKLVIREYLSMLKESGELDILLPDLLLAMGLKPLSKAQVGVRQYGVDIAAKGLDLDDVNKTDKLFLLTVKQGHLSRQNWDSDKIQDLRPSLNEILDVYLNKCVDIDCKNLPKKIIVCCNGDIKQDVELNWQGYKEERSKQGEIEFDFWGADKLSILIETYLFDEYIFPEKSRKNLRKTIALADQNEEEPKYFYALIKDTLDEITTKNQSSAKFKKEINKAFSTLNLSLNIVFYWCQEANNLLPALFCAERMLLSVWEFLRKQNLLEDTKIRNKYYQIFATYLNIARIFIIKIQPHCKVEHGLFGYAEAEEIEYPLRIFEIIGILGTFGIVVYNMILTEQDEETRQSFLTEIQGVSQILKSLILRNPAAFTPLYDNHANNIASALIVLQLAGESNFIQTWVIGLGNMMCTAYYSLGFYFPIHTNSYNDLVSIKFGKAPPKHEFIKASTILPMLADWYAIADLSNDYQNFENNVNKIFSHTNFMLWYPDENSEDFLYVTNAGYCSGVGVSLQIHSSIEDIQKRGINLLSNQENICHNMSCFIFGLFSLTAIASRHFKTPIFPILWQQFLNKPI